MSRKVFAIDEIKEETLRELLLRACGTFAHAAFFDSNGHRDRYSKYDWLAALGSNKTFTPTKDRFGELHQFRKDNPDWLFGHLTYELKNELEGLETRHRDKLAFVPLQFFVPRTVVYKQQGRIMAESLVYSTQGGLLEDLATHPPDGEDLPNLDLNPSTSREEYLRRVSSLKDHIRHGNIYEVNYCIEFAASAENFPATALFERLNRTSKAPFAAFYKSGDQYLLCASPERYLQKTGSNVISQPIKGTAKRSKDQAEDQLLRDELYHSEKERSENVMITDLVRNDLSRTAADGSVKVEELFGIYSFNTVHQMITTISSRLSENYSLADLLATTFPMGSMTGAPKISAMKLIDEHEDFARSLYAGTVGYITPSGDCDFNVVIRSIFHNGETGYLSVRVGSAITIHCDPEKEYEECLLKAENLFKSLKAFNSRTK